MPQGANTNTNKPTGTQPNQEIEKKLQKLEFPTLFQKNPNSSQT